MSNITINDLTAMKELDSKAMARVYGGKLGEPSVVNGFTMEGNVTVDSVDDQRTFTGVQRNALVLQLSPAEANAYGRVTPTMDPSDTVQSPVTLIGGDLGLDTVIG